MLSGVIEQLVKKHIAVEINSNPIRKGYIEVHPSRTICELYLKQGGISVIAGSDAHRCEEIGQDFGKVDAII